MRVMVFPGTRFGRLFVLVLPPLPRWISLSSLTKALVFVTFRNIHSLASYSLEGLSHWAVRELRGWLNTRGHLLKDTHTSVCEAHEYQTRETR